MRQNRCRNAFTLIELLTVIAIIGVLAALLFPAVKSSMLKAETTKAQTAMSGLSHAFRSYYTEYGKWPVSDSVNNINYFVDGNLVALLSGQDITVAPTKDTGGTSGKLEGNPRKIVFLEFKQADLGTITTCQGCFMDPWKQPYHYRLDVLYANSIPNPFDSSRPAITNGFLVWSAGPDGQQDPNCGDPPGPYNTTPCVNKDNVKSW